MTRIILSVALFFLGISAFSYAMQNDWNGAAMLVGFISSFAAGSILGASK